ncbi:MAG TPA: PorV/PorQ family protein [Flavilitoribacter sp.]|nr:PorV/PorQ family protein [Flavilitoribacter sp.]HMQ88578.1 PorV/PorQ family protein [Flavilitoribacter sp.]
MKRIYFNILSAFLVLLSGSGALFAGNPDRQGEAGAYELLMIPYARMAGLHAMNTSMTSGAEAMRLNIAGLARINKTEIVLGNAIYLQGTGIKMNALGLSQRVGKSGAFGLSLMALDFGDIRVTTTEQPEGTGVTFSPNFFNLGLGYSHVFENKISVGVLFRLVSESISDVSATGFAIDAGVQYVAGEKENFKFGISLRNIGSRMTFGGEGLSIFTQGTGDTDYDLTFSQRSAGFELPSVLNIGLSYDFYATENHRITVLGNFTANSFSQDQLGAGLEYSMKDLFMLRGGYKYEFGSEDEITAPIYTGLAAGATIQVPLSKENKNVKFGIDYAYRQTRLWNGTHNIGVRINI